MIFQKCLNIFLVVRLLYNIFFINSIFQVFLILLQ